MSKSNQQIIKEQKLMINQLQLTNKVLAKNLMQEQDENLKLLSTIAKLSESNNENHYNARLRNNQVEQLVNSVENVSNVLLKLSK